MGGDRDLPDGHRAQCCHRHHRRLQCPDTPQLCVHHQAILSSSPNIKQGCENCSDRKSSGQLVWAAPAILINIVGDRHNHYCHHHHHQHHHSSHCHHGGTEDSYRNNRANNNGFNNHSIDNPNCY